MKKKIFKGGWCTLGILVGTVITGFSQTLAIDFIEFKDRSVIIHYDLDDGANSTRQFLVQLYSSQDNFTAPLTRVTGDFGTEVMPGFDKKIVWDITRELGEAFKGDLSFELRGRVYVPFVKISNINAEDVFKRGKNYPLNWTSGNLSGQVNIELFNQEGVRLWGENNVPNIGKFDWYLPGNIKKGKDYKLKFTNARDRNDVVYSPSFTIKPKIPFLLKAGGVAVLVVGIYFVITHSESTTANMANADKPEPPGVPTN
ncbi:MAG: hypothetical protein DI538_20635 [Azospira oryzae]|nr:MAG: hypothetical protein DI538_20635 [Azospira oryzae]